MKKITITLLLLQILFSTQISAKFLTLKEASKKYNHPIKKSGNYIGTVVSWNMISPQDPTIPSGGNPFYYLRIKLKSGATVDSKFYYGVSFKNRGKMVATTDYCSKYSQADIHNCIYKMNKKYIKKGSQVEIDVGCGDMGCAFDSINKVNRIERRKRVNKPSIPVMIGGEPDMDACAVGVVKGLSKNGFLAVRSGPKTKYRLMDKLHNGDKVYLCDTKGHWEGIIYGDKRCLAGRDAPYSTIPKRKKYQGQCSSGWAYNKWFMIFD